MIPVINEKDKISYVNESYLIKFIEQNQSEMTWNQICNYIKDFINDEGKTFFEKNTIEMPYWIDEFFKVHPFLGDKIMFVFDD